MEANGVEVLGAVLEGRYRVDAPLARGGMSSVYSGVDLRLDRPVAIKVMESNFAQDRAFIDRFELEARSAARLHHPNVVAVHDQGVDGDHVYLVMELVSGGTLRDLLREGRLPVPVAISVLEPVLSALASAHHAGLVHRDVKPENVLIGAGGVVKVADFGLVRAVATAGITSDSTILGTVAYLSPEQVSTGAADARSDVYAAAIVCYEMLTGAPPYVGDTPISVAYRHVNDDVPPPSELVRDIPPALDDLVLRATRRDPALRPPDAAAFLDELIRTRNSMGLRRVPVPVPPAAPPLAAPPLAARPGPGSPAPASLAALAEARGRHRAEERSAATDPTVVNPTPSAATPRHEATQKVAAGALATQFVSPDATVRTPPVRPGPIGPQGTRAMSRSEYEAAAPMGGIGPDPYGMPAPPPPPPMARPRPTGRPRPPYAAQRQRGRRTMMTWVIVVLVLAAVLGVAAWWFGSGRWTAVPQIGGKDPVTAEHILQDADLSAAITQAHSDTVPAGQVISSSPPIGGRALRGSTITVVVSEGKPIVPDVTAGAQVQAVEKQVQDAQLTPRLVPAQDQYSATVPKGAVVGLNPGPGTQLKMGSIVVVILSKGPPPNPVPNVVGQPHDQAFATLQQAGFAPFDEAKAFDPNTPGNNVIKTDPPAGTVPTTGGSLRVGVVVSNAVTVPSVQGQSSDQAQQQLQQAGLQVQIQSFGGNNGNGQVFMQQPGANTIVQPGTTVTITVFP